MRFEFDLPTPLLLLVVLNVVQQPTWVSPLNCDKTFTYYEEYGQNSFNVSCSGITKGYEHILENITINNEISLTVTDSVLENVTPNIFKNVKNIRILDISNCTFEFDRTLVIFDKLKALETLIIRNTNFEVNNRTLQGLTNLKRLELGNNSIAAVEKGSFKDLVNLERLELADNHVKNLQDLQLCEFKKLKSLKLKRNLISSLKSYYFFCLKNTKSLDVNINSQPNVYHAYYFNVTSTTYDLIELDLSFNQIVELGYSLENLGKLRTLNVGNNKLVSAKNAHFKWLFRLQKLILSNNELRTFDSRVLVNKTQLSLLDLSHNALSSLTASDVPQLQYLNLEYNNLSGIYLRNLSSLKKVNLGFNKLKKLEPDSFRQVPYLVNLNLAGNSLDLSLGLFKGMEALRYLSLSNNSLSDIPDKVFLGLSNLRALDLSFNNLNDLHPDMFHDLMNLEVLNLSSNAIQSLSYTMVAPLTNLRTLDVAANKLTFIEYDVILSKLPSLNNINIKSNQLTCENLGQIIVFLKQKHIVYTNSEPLHLDSLSQNVAGIPCRPGAKKFLVAVETQPRPNVTLFNLGIFFLVVLVSVLTGIASYRFYIYLKRRRYRADEFELVVD